jgi:hypothetical protein
MSGMVVATYRLDKAAPRWLADAATRIGADPTAIRRLFPAAARHYGRGPLPDGWTVEDGVRVALLRALPLSGADLAAEVGDLYRYGDAAEKRAVLRGLAYLDGIGDGGLPVVRDALRTNDTRLVGAALGPYGATRLDPPAYRQGVLKCVFMGIPLDRIAGLPERRDAELVRMMRDYAAERAAAGRTVPGDVRRIAPEED